MKIPKKLKVGAHTYNVEISKTRDEKKGDGNWGKTMYARCQIYLDEHLVPSKQEETFLHEILHVAMDQSGLNVDFDREKEEGIVNRLTAALYPILKENNLLK